MKAKIKWYREILDLEPGSRVFFPLAKLLAQYGEYEEAAETLRKGLAHHPDHLEAQMLLLEILHGLGQVAEVTELARCLADRFVSHPGFWRAWAEAMNYSDMPGAFPMSLHVLSAMFGGKAISWDEVVEKGIAAVFAANQPSGPATSISEVGAAAPFREDSASFEEHEEQDETEAIDDEGDDVLVQAEDLPTHDGTIFAPGAEPELETQLDQTVLASLDDEEDIEDESEESISLRTMTMAGLMAEQGDYEGALDIYEELLGASTDQAEQAKLTELVQSMRQKMAEKSDKLDEDLVADAPHADEKWLGLNGKIKLKQTLEILARRLEDRLSST